MAGRSASGRRYFDAGYKDIIMVTLRAGTIHCFGFQRYVFVNPVVGRFSSGRLDDFRQMFGCHTEFIGEKLQPALFFIVGLH